MAFPLAPAQLVTGGRQQLGRFSTPPERANLLDAPLGWLPRPLRRFRLKEWQALQISTPRLFANLALFDAKLLQLLQVKVFDRATRTKHLHERQLRPGAFRIADQLRDSTNTYSDRRSTLTFKNHVADGWIEVDIDVAATDHAPRITGHLTVHVGRGASQVVSLPFADDVGMYSHKGMFPVEGELVVGTERHTLSATDSLALLDDHKGYYPYIMRWDWLTAATHDASGVARGVNLTRNQCREPDTYNENCAWIGEALGTLPAVTFVRERVGTADELWRVRDRDGRVDVTFRPTVPGNVRVQAIVVESRYRGPFGVLSGRVEPEGLPPIELGDWFGMGEEFYLRC